MTEGYFSEILREMGGDNSANNLKSFRFERSVINQYTDLSKTNPMEFKVMENVGVLYVNHIGKWDLKCNLNKDGTIGAILIDLSNLPPEQQEWWANHLIDKSPEKFRVN